MTSAAHPGRGEPLPGITLDTSRPPGATCERPRSQEVRWLADQRALLADLCDGGGDPEALGDLVDAVAQRGPGGAPPAALTCLVGVGFGDLVVRRVPGLGWTVLRHGTTSELVLTHATHPLVLRPLTEVEAAWSAQRPGWVSPALVRAVQRARALLRTVG